MSNAVECYSGSRYAERPTAVVWEGQRLAVQEILGGWRVPDGMRFKVIAGDGLVFELVYDEAHDDWKVKQIE